MDKKESKQSQNDLGHIIKFMEETINKTVT